MFRVIPMSTSPYSEGLPSDPLSREILYIRKPLVKSNWVCTSPRQGGGRTGSTAHEAVHKRVWRLCGEAR